MLLFFRKSVATTLFGLVISLGLTGSICAQISPELRKRPVTVADIIEMTTLGDYGYFQGQSTEGRVAQFSPDRKRFLIFVRKGNVQNNTNEYSLYLFRTADAVSTPKPHLLVTMASSSNRDAIHGIRWSLDGQTLTFVGERKGEDPQIYRFDIGSRRLTKITNHPRGVNDYGISGDGTVVVFSSDAPDAKASQCKPGQKEGIVVTSQRLASLVAGDCTLSHDAQLFVQQRGRSEVRIPLGDPIYHADAISVSPDGRYAMAGVYVRDVPREWAGYASKDIQQLVATPRRKGEATTWKQYIAIDISNLSFRPLLNAPMPGLLPYIWAHDGQSVYIKCYIPLDSNDPEEQKARSERYFAVHVKLPEGAFDKISEADWQTVINGAREPLKIKLDEDLNLPPKIYASPPDSDKKMLLMDLNPQFKDLDFGRVEQIKWRATKDIELIGGLYYPVDYKSGQSYPLVIQTHGFEAQRFSMDGNREWSSGFAARALAARGVFVLQGYDYATDQDDERASAIGSLGATGIQAYKKSAVLGYEQAIDYLDSRGLIDRDKVGISGFSRTVCDVAYMLTHPEHKFAVATLTDGIDCGYTQYIDFPHLAWDFDGLNGGASPFGKGLDEWLKESPSFNLDKVQTPVRVVALGSESVLEMWEWYSALTLQKKPVDFVEILDGLHLLQRPWDRRIAQQGLVDWFCFWLKGEEDPDPAKAEQYERWRGLRKLQEQKRRPPVNN